MKGIRQQVLDCNHRHTSEVVNCLARENARQQTLSILQESPLLKSAVTNGSVLLTYAMYDMDSGMVEYFDLDDKTQPVASHRTP